MFQESVTDKLVNEILNWHLSKYPQIVEQNANRQSLDAIKLLVTSVLVPISQEFGDIKITYGFTSHNLLKEIRKTDPKGIAPALDQHASHETSSKGDIICPRLGAAADFIVNGQKSEMHLVADWISKNTAFDRLYFYGPTRPIHVTVGPDNKRAVQIMDVSKLGKRVPGKRGVRVPFSSIYPME